MMPRLHPDPPLSPLVWKTADTYSPLFIFFLDDLNVLISFFFLSSSSSSSSSYFSIMIEDVIIRLERRDIYRIFVRFEFYLSKKRKLGNRAYQFSAREKMAALSYPSRYLTPF